MGSRNGKRRIVVADDSKFWRDKIATVIARSGHEVIAVENGISAIRLCMDAERPIDMVVVDLIMPGVDGFEVARYLRSERRTEKVPIIGITGLFKPDDFPDGPQSQGFEAIIEKSSSPDQFLFVFNKFLTRGRRLNRPAPRVPTHLPAEYRCGNGDSGRCVVANLSATGAFMSTLKPLEPGAEITIAFAIPDGPSIRTTALVIWVNESSGNGKKSSYSRGMGVIFRRMQLGLQLALERYIEKELERT